MPRRDSNIDPARWEWNECILPSIKRLMNTPSAEYGKKADLSFEAVLWLKGLIRSNSAWEKEMEDNNVR